MTEREKRIIYSDNKKKKGNADRKFSKKQIVDYMDKYIRNYLVDSEWHISIATDFLHLLNDEKIELNKLSD